MSTEIELKLALHPEDVNDVKSTLNAHFGNQSVDKKLVNCYFDTPDLCVKNAKAAFRVRQTPSGYVQTLKTQGSSQGGLSKRVELESEIPSSAFDVPLALQFLSEAGMAHIDVSALQPVFETNFMRHTWDITLNGSQIEVVLDEGQIICQEESYGIAEIECELKQGSLNDVLALWEQLESIVTFVPFDISKAERGYQHFLEASLWQQFKPQISDYTQSHCVIEGLLMQELQVLQNVIVQVFEDETWLEEVFQQASIRLIHYLTLYSFLSKEKEECIAQLRMLTANQLVLDEDYIRQIAKWISQLSRLLVTHTMETRKC